MSDLPSPEAVGASLAVVDSASTMGVDPIVRYPTLRLILDAYRDGLLANIELPMQYVARRQSSADDKDAHGLDGWSKRLWTLQNDWVAATSADGKHRLTTAETGLLDDVRHFLELVATEAGGRRWVTR